MEELGVSKPNITFLPLEGAKKSNPTISKQFVRITMPIEFYVDWQTIRWVRTNEIFRTRGKAKKTDIVVPWEILVGFVTIGYERQKHFTDRKFDLAWGSQSHPIWTNSTDYCEKYVYNNLKRNRQHQKRESVVSHVQWDSFGTSFANHVENEQTHTNNLFTNILRTQFLLPLSSSLLWSSLVAFYIFISSSLIFCVCVMSLLLCTYLCINIFLLSIRPPRSHRLNVFPCKYLILLGHVKHMLCVVYSRKPSVCTGISGWLSLNVEYNFIKAIFFTVEPI